MNYARARRRMWYEAEKGRKIQQSRLDRETRIDALKEALSGNSSLECLLVGEKTWNRANWIPTKKFECDQRFEMLSLSVMCLFFRKKGVEFEWYTVLQFFHNFLNDELLQGLTVEELRAVTWPVRHKTARVWMHRLGFGFGTHIKDIYFDGYDRADVVEYKFGFLKRMDAYQKRSHLFFRSSVTMLGSNTCFLRYSGICSPPRKLWCCWNSNRHVWLWQE